MTRHRWPKPLAPEFQALCALLGRRIESSGKAEAEQHPINQVTDWRTFVAGAKRHRITALIQPVLDTLPKGTLPSFPHSQLHRIAYGNAIRGLKQISELNRLLQMFRSDEIKVLVLKGVVLSQALYGDPLQRGIGDIDLLINAVTFDRAHGLLLRAGYSCLDTVSNAPLPSSLRVHVKDVAYAHPDGHLVELHLRLWEHSGAPEGDFPSLWQHRQTIVIQHIAIPTLPSSILPLYLLEHGTRHCWDRLCWLADLAILLQDTETLESMLKQAHRHGLDRAARQAVWLINTWFGTTLRLDNAAATGKDMAWFVRVFFSKHRWLERPQTGSRAWFIRETQRRYWRLIQGGGWHHIRIIAARTLFNPVDAAIFHLPRCLTWLYPVLRPVGWVIRNFFHRPNPPR